MSNATKCSRIANGERSDLSRLSSCHRDGNPSVRSGVDGRTEAVDAKAVCDNASRPRDPAAYSLDWVVKFLRIRPSGRSSKVFRSDWSAWSS